LTTLLTAAALLGAGVPSALANGGTPFGLSCAAQPAYGNVRFCSTSAIAGHDTRVRSFDGTPIGLNVTLPATGGGRLPLVVISHGWGGPRADVTQSAPWAERGYAVLAIDARGFNDSCGSAQSRQADPTGCAHGWIQLDDPRYELRDIQYLTGLLVDEGFVNPVRIGLYGWSYGGAVSLEGAILRNRVMYPDGSLHPWKSPNGVPLRIAAASPSMTWSDLFYSLLPNGRTLDYTVTDPSADRQPIGVLKQSLLHFLLYLGERSGYFPPPGADPDFDPLTWVSVLGAGEPMEGNPKVLAIEQSMMHRSPYYLKASGAPAPMLLQSGWADDLFPADEMLRYYNRTMEQYRHANLALMFIDYGHPRSQNAPGVEASYDQHRLYDWFDYYVKGDRRVTPLTGVEATTSVCNGHPGVTHYAPNWVATHPGEVRYLAAAPQTILSNGGDPSISAAIDPIAAAQSGKNDCVTTQATDEPGTANWRLPVVTGRGYTLLGAPTIVATVSISGSYPELAGRLWDVAPNGTQTLIARGLYRPTGSGQIVFQLHPNAWHFVPGDVVKLQLLGRDAPYARQSNGTFTITVSHLDLRLPVHEQPGSGQVRAPAPLVVPCGSKLAPGVMPLTHCAGGFFSAEAVP
jgi:predicted acyl esterase